jgi:hypothetical protein
MEGETFWLDGVEKKAVGKGKTLCSKDLIHYYNDKILAIIFNPIHAKIQNPRLIEIEIDNEISHDGLKGGCKTARYIKEIDVPVVSLEQRVKFAVIVALSVYKDETFSMWAQDWLSGKDRTMESAKAAMTSAVAASVAVSEVSMSAFSAAEAASWAASSALWAAAWDAERVERTTERALWAVARAAEEATAAGVARAAEIFLKIAKSI